MTGDASDAVVKAANHAIQFDAEDESSDEDFDAMCRIKRRYDCWKQCRNEGETSALRSGCRQTCRAGIDCDGSSMTRTI